MRSLDELLALKNEVLVARSAALQRAPHSNKARWLYQEYDWLYQKICQREFEMKLPFPLPGRGR